MGRIFAPPHRRGRQSPVRWTAPNNARLRPPLPAMPQVRRALRPHERGPRRADLSALWRVHRNRRAGSVPFPGHAGRRTQGDATRLWDIAIHPDEADEVRREFAGTGCDVRIGADGVGRVFAPTKTAKKAWFERERQLSPTRPPGQMVKNLRIRWLFSSRYIDGR